MNLDLTSNSQEKIENIEPPEVFRAFSKISSIPRESGNERGISNFLVRFAENLDLEVHQDEALNVIIKKKGSPGYETAPTVILQGHMDMVCEKNEGINHCFETDPLKLVLKENILSARGTTLGADNGIAIAYAMALLESTDIAHPSLEVLITTNEEVGLKGAAKVDPTLLSGKILINLDAEVEGQFIVSCSGGSRFAIALPLEYESATQDSVLFELKITGLKGGHSGLDIHLGRGNANKLLGRILQDLFQLGADIVGVSGKGKVNAISRNARAEILIAKNSVEEAKRIVREYLQIFRNELMETDSQVEVMFKELSREVTRVISRQVAEKIVILYSLIPSGVQTMSQSIKGLVESSLNLGTITCFNDNLQFEGSVRSSVDGLRKEICTRLKNVATVTGARYILGSTYPAWEYRKESPIRDLVIDVFREKYDSEPEISAIHAGLECGILGEILKDMDMIALGPDIFNAHTPEEHLDVQSTRRTWDLLRGVLAKIS